MLQYRYVARNAEGKLLRGVLEADDLSDFYRRLEQAGLLCCEYEERQGKQRKRGHRRLRNKELSLFCRRLGTTLTAGMSITSCLDIMCQSAEKPALARLYLELYESIKSGQPLSAAMRECNGVFPLLLINLMESGEESGSVDLVCKKLAVYYEKQSKLDSKIKTATTYPKLLCLLAVGVIIILFAFVLPNILDTFSDMELPVITVVMIWISNLIVNRWSLLLLGAVALFAAVRLLLAMPRVQLAWHTFLLHIPKVGKLLKKIYSGRFADTLSLLYASGLPLLNGIRLSSGVIGNSCIQHRLRDVIQSVSVGQSVSSALAATRVFDPLLPGMVRIGEESGSLDDVLTTLSEYYEQETETAIDSLLGLLEPLLLVVMALIIGTVMVAVLLPIFQGYSSIL